MTTPSKLNRLAERVEAATGRDIKLLHAIAEYAGLFDGDIIPEYLTSLDAAMTLAEGTGKSVPKLLALTLDRLSYRAYQGGAAPESASEWAQLLARYFTARCLREAARADGGEGECQKCRGSGWMNIGGGTRCDACDGFGRVQP